MKRDGAKALILYVEDDAVISEMYKLRLDAEGYDVRVAVNGREGIELAEKERPDLILLDILMEEMDGFDTLRNLKTHILCKKIPVVMLTNLDGDMIIRQARDLGALDLWVKTKATPSEVVAGVKKILGK